ncbi:putative membrane protein [Sinomicrobium oceani]|uniref:Putative membrane protein n=1 Tax=Sinomicrobium oceani TaxID=1150368 RepID=A0A1K1QNF4_9FLAO|nr:bestrophin family ion channel [Sinomicrobium oceani]SFW61163.1 putative membrane protein [Sinomicrobium oceani]
MLLNNKIPLKYLFRKTGTEIIFVSVLTLIVSLSDMIFHKGSIAIPLVIPTILGTAISLILAFRTAQSYNRWWEARMIWGAIVNDSRTLTRQLLTFISPAGQDNAEGQNIIKKMVYRQIAWNYALGQSLRKTDPLENTTGFISEDELQWVRKQNNIPNALLQLHSADLKKAFGKGWLSDFQQIQIDTTIRRLCDSMGKSERIKNTVFPATYSLIVHLTIYLFVIMLPFGLVDSLGFVQVPLVITVAVAFFLIEKTAIYLQDPFENMPTDTPVTAIARTIEINLKQMLNEEKTPENIKPVAGFYLM